MVKKANKSSLTGAQERALVWLWRHGREGVVDKNGYVIAQGDRARQFDTATWLRLFAAGLLEGRSVIPRIVISHWGIHFIQANDLLLRHPETDND